MDEEQFLTIKEAVAPQLFALAGVCGVGLGFKHIGGQRTDRPAIMVFVTQKLALDDVPPGHVVPREIQGVTTDIFEMGQLRAQVATCDPEDFDQDNDPYDPLKAGSRLHVLYEDLQISPGELTTLHAYASLGCFATTNTNPPKQVFITTQHSLAPPTNRPLAGFASCPSQDEAVRPLVGQPRVKGSQCSECCKRVAGKATKLSFAKDCGAVEIKRGLTYRNEIVDLGVIRGKRTLPMGVLADQFTVKKRGFVTRVREGTALSVHTDVNYQGVCDRVDPLTHEITFSRPLHKLVVIRPKDDPSCYSAEGDSGAPVVDEDMNLIGIHVGGGGQLAVVLPVDEIESELGVTIVTGDQGVVTVTAPNVELAPARNGAAIDESDPVLEAARRAQSELLEIPRGRDVGRDVEAHLDELLHLANRNRRFMLLWHRSGGPTWIQRVLQCIRRRNSPLPSEMRGLPVQEALNRILDELTVQGSSELAASVGRHREWLVGVSGKTYEQVLTDLRAPS